MLKQYPRFVTLCALACALLAVVPAQAQEAESFDDMSLEALLSVEVVTASKNAESLSDAPGVVTTITAREIEQFGATNLLEVLERVPGVYNIGTSQYPQGMVSIRGDAATASNNHVLVLLNGRPMRESLSGGHNTALYTAFPLESIERLEVVRGPGSVLYGSNAYAGVVNIITKEAEEGVSVGTSAGYGSFGARSFAAQGGYRQGDLSVSAGLHLFKEEGQGEYTAFVPTEDPMVWVPQRQNVGQVFNLGEDVMGATLSARYKGLSFRSFAGFNKEGFYPGGFDPNGTIDFGHVTADLGYEQPVTGWWDASINTTFTYDEATFLGAESRSHDFIVEATNYVRPFDKANLVVGGLVYSLYGENMGEWQDFFDPTSVPEMIAFVEPYDALWWSAYTQFDVRPIRQLKLIAGGQVNKVEGLDLDFVPRLGAVLNLTETFGAKLLYGQAFRSPYAMERTINVPGFQEGNPNLRPEKVTSLDAQVFYNAARVQLAATYFNARQTDLIIETSYLAPGAFFPTSTFENQGGMTIQGVELESKVAPTDRLYFTGSLVYQRSENEAGEWGTTLVPEVMAKVGVSYAAPQGVTLGLFNNYYSQPRGLHEVDPASWADPVTGEFNPASWEAFGMNLPPKAFHYATAKLTLDVTKLMNLRRFPTMQLDFYATNLLGQEIFVSDIEKGQLALPRQAGRSFYGALRVKL